MTNSKISKKVKEHVDKTVQPADSNMEKAKKSHEDFRDLVMGNLFSSDKNSKVIN